MANEIKKAILSNKTTRKIARSLGIIKTVAPSFFIIGGQKCGTSYLFNLLNQQANIASPAKKEIDFFSTDSHYQKGEKWYLEHFVFKKHKTSFEACPNYMYYPKSLQRLYDFNPNAKIIILLRNPTERAFSAWNMHQKMWKTGKKNLIDDYYKHLDDVQKKQGISFINTTTFPTFKDAVQAEISALNNKKWLLNEPGFVARGLYEHQISSVFSYFSEKQVLIIEKRELENTALLCAKLEDFLQLSINPIKISKELKFSGLYQDKMDKESKGILKKFYYPENEKLFQLIKKRYDWE